MAQVRCPCCGRPQSECGSIYEVRDLRGNCFTLACGDCHIRIAPMLDKLARMHGAYIDEEGTQWSSPKGSPRIYSVTHLAEITGIKF